MRVRSPHRPSLPSRNALRTSSRAALLAGVDFIGAVLAAFRQPTTRLRHRHRYQRAFTNFDGLRTDFRTSERQGDTPGARNVGLRHPHLRGERVERRTLAHEDLLYLRGI